MRQILIIIGLFCGIYNSFSQSIKIESRETIDNFYNQIILDVNILDNGYSILGRKNDETGYNYHYYLTTIDRNLKLINQKEIINRDTIYYYQDCILGKNSEIFCLGYIDKEPEEMLSFIIGFNNNFKQNFKLFLNEKHEGNIKGFYKDNKLFVITNDNSSYKIYIISDKGKIIDEKTIKTGFAETFEDLLLYKDFFLIYGWSIKDNKERFDIIKFNYDCNIINQKSTEFINTPISFNKINDEDFAVVFESTPSTISFYNSDIYKIKDITHIRHDYKYKYVINIEDLTNLYIGLNIDKLTAFVVKETDVISKVELCDIGIWGKSIVKRLNENEFIVFTDKKRTSDFESNIEVIKLKIE